MPLTRLRGLRLLCSVGFRFWVQINKNAIDPIEGIETQYQMYQSRAALNP